MSAQYRVEISSAPLQCHLSCFASKIDGTQNIRLASLEPKTNVLCLMRDMSMANLPPTYHHANWTKRGKRGALEGEDPTVVRFEKPSPKGLLYLSSRSFLQMEKANS